MDEFAIYRRAFQAYAEADLGGATQATLRAMLDATGADRGFFLLAGEDGIDPIPLAVLGSLPLDEGPSTTVCRRALETRAPVRIENALEEPSLFGKPSILGLSLLSILAVPVLGPDAPLGIVYLDSARLKGIFTEEQVATAVRVAEASCPSLRIARRLREAERREEALRDRLAAAEGGPPLLGDHPRFREALDLALKAAPSDASVLLLGESGTGKEVFARAIHRASRRADGPFVAINCGALPEGTLESELFGVREGAFTGATEDRAGLVEAADGGTLFLDEVGDMPAPLQGGLLRVLQEGEVRRVGDAETRRVSVRIISATHRDLSALVGAGRFREDLLYRLRVVGVTLPALRHRGDDVLLLARAFLRRFAAEEGRALGGFTPAADERLLSHPFPGNVRELQNAVRRAVVFATGARVDVDDLPPEIGGPRRPAAPPPPRAVVPKTARSLKDAKEEMTRRLERAFLADLLERAGGNVSRAARLAGMNRTVLHDLMARHEVSADTFRPES